MKNHVLSFSGGCAINLDELGDFPDYFEVITKLIEQIKEGKPEVSLLNTFLDADLQDVEHIPQFKELMRELTQKYQAILKSQMKSQQDKEPSMLKKFLVFVLKLVKNYFTSYSMQEEDALPLIKIVQKQLSNNPEYFTDFLLSIAVFAAHAEKHEQIIDLYLKIANERPIFQSQDMAIAYIKSVDKILRFRDFRHVIEKRLEGQVQIGKRLPYLYFKYSLYRYHKGSKQTNEHFLSFLGSVNKEKESQFVKDYIQKWSQQLK